ncbi:MAG: HD domain-containing protein [Thermomicrobiales bacterium]
MSMMYEIAEPIPASLALIQASMSRDDAERVERAYRFARAAHNGQLRDEGTPFIEHPVRVAEILWQELGVRNADLIVAALNHDVIEDSEAVDEHLVASAFGEVVAKLVVDVTKISVPPEEKAARDRAYLDRLPDLPVDSRLLKLADRIDNLRSVLLADDLAKARRYLDVSQDEFVPLATMTDPVALRLVIEACDAIERMLRDLDGTRL